MLKNYLVTALRSLNRHRFFSLINVAGLSVALTICMAIMMLVADQLSYDRYNSNRDRIYRVNSRPLGADGIGQADNDYASSPLPLAQALTDNHACVQMAGSLTRGFGNEWLELEQNVNIPLSGFFADPQIIDILQLEFELGDPRTALNEPFSVILTRKAANKLFSDRNPIGKTFKMGEQGLYTVTGVLADNERKSHIFFDGLASMSTRVSLEKNGKLDKMVGDWTQHWTSWTYVMIKPDFEENDLQAALDDIYKTNIAPETDPEVQKVIFYTQSLMDITPGPFLGNSIGPFLPWLFVYFFCGLGALILITSCFNFTNLSVARSLTRAREIGVRKASGAARWQIFSQFMMEAIVAAIFSLCVAFALLAFLRPLILSLSFARMFHWDLTANMYVYIVFLLFALFTGSLAGLFPALVLSGFKPVQVLKNIGSMKLFSRMGLRKALLISQFTISLIFILSVLVVYQQLRLFTGKDHGFEVTNSIVIRLNGTSSDLLKDQLAKSSGITSFASSSHIPAAGSTWGFGMKRSMDEPDWTSLSYFSVDDRYVETMGLQLVAGKNFAASPGANKGVILNEKAVSDLHFSSPIEAVGSILINHQDSSQMEIIGVVKDYNHQLLIQEISGMALLMDTSKYQIMHVRHSGTPAEGLAAVTTAWQAANPGLKMDARNLEDELGTFYKIVFGDLVSIIAFIAVLAIMISCLGLLGMATYATETRLREISIRKVLGGDSRSLILLLSKGFLAILLISAAIGIPAAWLLNNLWLEFIAYHISFGPEIILIGTGFMVVLGLITIGSQTLRAVRVNPVENLKSE